MANRYTTSRRPSFAPLYPLIFVKDKGLIEIPAQSVSPERVGEKAFGLSCLPKSWTLPFIVISEDLLALYCCCRETDRSRLLKRWVTRIIKAAMSVGILEQDPIIVRSSGFAEGLEERGKYYSFGGTLKTLLKPLNDCLHKISTDADLTNKKIPLVIQKFADPISAKGHLSNERRCYEEKRDWLGEFEEKSKPFKINLRNWRKKIVVANLIDKSLECNLSAHISEVLKIPAAWVYERNVRLHFEWVWDGRIIYLVQADQEHEVNGINPTKIHQSMRIESSGFVPKMLRIINEEHGIQYHKIRNVFTYKKLGLPITNIYILDNPRVINALATGEAPSALKNDLGELVKGSLVIRMDIATDDQNKRMLLPRTNEIREVDSALAGLKNMSEMIMRQNTKEKVAFIFHNFIPAASSAFAYAAPGERKVQIEALWGLPEGLYYYSHDKYIVDTQNPRIKELHRDDIDRFDVHKKHYFKRFFVVPDKDGHWTNKILGPPYDWNGSIQKQMWVKEIALESRRISEEEQSPLSVMWFIDVPTEVFSRPILPWYHETYDPRIIRRTMTNRTKTPFDKSLIIRTSKDIEELKKEAEKTQSSVRYIEIQPCEESLLRNKDMLREIGELAQKIDAVIQLEGGVLSHAYYQLIKTNARVEVKHPFWDFEEQREFNKLVRDKVPSNIQRGGEVVSKTHLSGERLLRALREKLVEEAFETLDAIDQDSIVDELADVIEIVDGILHQLCVSREKLQQRQDQKRNKAGGFKDGIVLLDTRNPLPTKKGSDTDDTLFNDLGNAETQDGVSIEIPEAIKLGHNLDKWSDRREHQATTEVLMQLLIPMIQDNWSAITPETVVDSDSDNVIRANLKGTRFGSKLQIVLSIFSRLKQLKLPL